ncbi:MAG TPA: lactate utilization protein [Candidatus Baltobacteraceae bacterium]|nr:lactate utilization protein [Candidatus Baltobacteraceae bacterium]
MDWTTLANDATVEKTAKALTERGIEAIVVETGEEARQKVLELIPKKSEVMHVSSTTLAEIGVSKDIDESGEFDSLRKRIMAITDAAERNEFRRKTLSPDYGIGSVQAVTEDGQVVIASASGSQLPVYAYGATKLIWVVGTQKIVKDMDAAMKRIYEQALPLESERVKVAYGMARSSVNKILVFEREKPGRITLIFVKQKLGF